MPRFLRSRHRLTARSSVLSYHRAQALLEALLKGKILTCDDARNAFLLLDHKTWHPEQPPVRQGGGNAFVHLSDAQRDPGNWAMPNQPDLSKLKAMVLAMEQILAHFHGGKIDGKRWQLRHMHALWEVFFPGTPPPQKLSDLQMYELEADFPPGTITAAVIIAKCALFADDLLNTSGDAQPAAAATLGVLAEAVGAHIGVGAVDKAAASGRTLLIATNLRPSQCVQKRDGDTARSKGPFIAAAHGHLQLQRPTRSLELPCGPRGEPADLRTAVRLLPVRLLPVRRHCVWPLVGSGCKDINGVEAKVAVQMQHRGVEKVTPRGP